MEGPRERERDRTKDAAGGIRMDFPSGGDCERDEWAEWGERVRIRARRTRGGRLERDAAI